MEASPRGWGREGRCWSGRAPEVAQGSSESPVPTSTPGEPGNGGEPGCAGPKAAVPQLVLSMELLCDRQGWWHEVPEDISCSGALSSSREAAAEAETQMP